MKETFPSSSKEPLTLSTRTEFAAIFVPILAIALLVAVSASPATAQSFSFTTLDYPGAIATTASGINNQNVIVGDYTDTEGFMHAYLWTSGGGFMSLDYPGAIATSLWAITDKGEAVGYYLDGNDNTHGFSFVPPNTFTTIDYPEASFTIAYGINNSGEIVGTWVDSSGQIQSGFALINGEFTNLSYPDSTSTLASGVNSAGNICGIWFDTNGTVHGFTLTTAIGGVYTDFDDPGAATTGSDKINDNFQIGGYTTDPNQNEHGLLAAPLQNQYLTLDYPNSIATIIRGLNNQPVPVGHYTDTSEHEHGFYATQTGLTFTLTVTTLGTGNGTVTDDQQQIDCTDTDGVQSGICSATYNSGTTVNLTASPIEPSTFGGWGGACTGTDGCSVLMNSNQAVTASFVPLAVTVDVPFTCPGGVFPCTNVTAPPAVFNCPSGKNPCPDPNAHSLTLTAAQVNTAFTMTVAATEVPIDQADGDCEFGDTPANDFDCRFTSFFPFETLQNGDIIVPICDAYSNGNCVFYSVFFGSRGNEPPDSDYAGPILWSIAWNNTSFVPPPTYPYQVNNPRLYDDPDLEVSPITPYGTDCNTPMLINGIPTDPPIFCQFVFDITTYYDPNQPPDAGIGGRTKQFNDVVVAFPLTVASPSLSTTKTADQTQVNAGSPIGYTVTMSNSPAPGTGTATNTRLSDPLPAGAGVAWTINPPYTGPGACAIPAGTNMQVLVCSLGSLSPAITGSVHVVSANSSVGTYVNTATLSADNNPPQTATATIQVSGSGPIANVSPAKLDFHDIHIGTHESAYVTLSNIGDAPMTVGPVKISHPGNDLDDFSVTNLCPPTLAAGGSCKIQIVCFPDQDKYHPTATLSISDNAPGSPQLVPLSATVINPRAKLTPKALNFGNQKVDTTSPPQTATLTNIGTTPLVLRKMTISGAFAFASGTTCSNGTKLAPNAQCTINVTFTPHGTGERKGCVTIHDNTLFKTHKVELSGVGD